MGCCPRLGLGSYKTLKRFLIYSFLDALGNQAIYPSVLCWKKGYVLFTLHLAVEFLSKLSCLLAAQSMNVVLSVKVVLESL